eukprot:TRINITY_DN964_c0_g1_i13.p1 TRINITY_DN964_c0_g1~~TRINITY_DN964_c0_g1_i13.p1  ORF type:complete len:515 (+),score=87.08 TRINITY_DN964_c0_g1_i13:153-1697(+)
MSTSVLALESMETSFLAKVCNGLFHSRGFYGEAEVDKALMEQVKISPIFNEWKDVKQAASKTFKWRGFAQRGRQSLARVLEKISEAYPCLSSVSYNSKTILRVIKTIAPNCAGIGTVIMTVSMFRNGFITQKEYRRIADQFSKKGILSFKDFEFQVEEKDSYWDDSLRSQLEIILKRSKFHQFDDSGQRYEEVLRERQKNLNSYTNAEIVSIVAARPELAARFIGHYSNPVVRPGVEEDEFAKRSRLEDMWSCEFMTKERFLKDQCIPLHFVDDVKNILLKSASAKESANLSDVALHPSHVTRITNLSNAIFSVFDDNTATFALVLGQTESRVGLVFSNPAVFDSSFEIPTSMLMQIAHVCGLERDAIIVDIIEAPVRELLRVDDDGIFHLIFWAEAVRTECKPNFAMALNLAYKEYLEDPISFINGMKNWIYKIKDTGNICQCPAVSGGQYDPSWKVIRQIKIRFSECCGEFRTFSKDQIETWHKSQRAYANFLSTPSSCSEKCFLEVSISII